MHWGPAGCQGAREENVGCPTVVGYVMYDGIHTRRGSKCGTARYVNAHTYEWCLRIGGGGGVFTLKRSFYPTTSAVPTVSFLILHLREIQVMWSQTVREKNQIRERIKRGKSSADVPGTRAQQERQPRNKNYEKILNK